jgi:hypothetical protein
VPSFVVKNEWSYMSIAFTADVGTSLPILGAFEKLRKTTVSFVMSILVEQLGSKWTDSHEIWYLNIFFKPVEKTQVSLHSEKNNGYFA